MVNVAVIGAGIAGLTAARSLHDHGIIVTVFDKGRGVGGRMATRRTERGLQFDHGAQYFNARDALFEHSVQSWLADAIVARWKGKVGVIKDGEITESQRNHDRYVGVPAMNSVCKHLARDLNVQCGIRVAPLEPSDGRLTVKNSDAKSLGEFDWIIITAPALQTADLLASVAPQLATQAAAVSMQGCWAAMVGFDGPLQLPIDGAFVHDSLLAWVARNSSKPNRIGNGDCWVLHANPQWSEEHIEEDKTDVAPVLLSEFWRATGHAEVEPNHLTAHLWRYAIPPEPLAARCLTDPKLKIAVCGDWCCGARVEGAFLSGMSAASTCLRSDCDD